MRLKSNLVPVFFELYNKDIEKVLSPINRRPLLESATRSAAKFEKVPSTSAYTLIALLLLASQCSYLHHGAPTCITVQLLASHCSYLHHSATPQCMMSSAI